jgi:hypothetical protein
MSSGWNFESLPVCGLFACLTIPSFSFSSLHSVGIQRNMGVTAVQSRFLVGIRHHIKTASRPAKVLSDPAKHSSQSLGNLG